MEKLVLPLLLVLVRLLRQQFETGYNLVDLFTDAGLVPTKSEARRLVQQGGAFVRASDTLQGLTDISARITLDHFSGEGELVLRAGKKRYCRIILT